MGERYTVKLKTIVENVNLTIIHKSKGYEDSLVYTPDLNRPGLQLAGFYDYFDPERIQVIGRVETTYLSKLSQGERRKSFERLMSAGIVALIISRGQQPFPECLEAAKKYDVNLLSTDSDTSQFMAQLIWRLNLYLAPRETLHGVLVEVYGEGLLMMGDSGIGKSETALELVKRGHRLIADDAVEVRRTSRITLVGTAPEMIRYYMEVRGIGIIDVRHIFGVGAVKPATRIDLVVNLKVKNEEQDHDRLGLETEHTSILDVEVPCTTIPVMAGRNLAVILEAAAINNRQKKMGYNAAIALTEQHDASIDSGWLSL